MTTVSTPGGTPAPTYNRSGVTINALAPTGTTQATGAQITRYAGLTIITTAYVNASNLALVLPSGADIGDAVEIYNDTSIAGANSVQVYPPSGESILGSSPALIGSGSFFRKVSSTVWAQQQNGAR